MILPSGEPMDAHIYPLLKGIGGGSMEREGNSRRVN